MALRERPDLILLDLQLPKMDGMEVLRDLRKRQMYFPVVLVTAWRTEKLVLDALRLGVKDYITKPFTMHDMLDAVHRALTEGRLRRERDTLIKQLQASNQELGQRVSQLTALYEVGQALASTLDLEETLLALGVSVTANPTAQLCVERLKELRGCDVHMTHIPTPGDETGLRRLGVHLTSDPSFATKDLFVS